MVFEWCFHMTHLLRWNVMTITSPWATMVHARINQNRSHWKTLNSHSKQNYRNCFFRKRLTLSLKHKYFFLWVWGNPKSNLVASLSVAPVFVHVMNISVNFAIRCHSLKLNDTLPLHVFLSSTFFTEQVYFQQFFHTKNFLRLCGKIECLSNDIVNVKTSWVFKTQYVSCTKIYQKHVVSALKTRQPSLCSLNCTKNVSWQAIKWHQGSLHSWTNVKVQKHIIQNSETNKPSKIGSSIRFATISLRQILCAWQRHGAILLAAAWASKGWVPAIIVDICNVAIIGNKNKITNEHRQNIAYCSCEWVNWVFSNVWVCYLKRQFLSRSHRS